MTTQFAGFTWPRAVPRLVPPDYCGLPAPLARLTESRNAYMRVAAKMGHRCHVDRLPYHAHKVDTSYQITPKPGAHSLSFYMGSDFSPGLRWKGADEVDDVEIRHEGWYSDALCDDTIRGFVMALPQGRGFLAGWSMGEGMISELSYETHETEQRAAHRADQMAKLVAEAERDASEALEDEAA